MSDDVRSVDEGVKPFPKTALWVFGSLFGGLALALAAVGIQDEAASREFRAALADAKKAGFATELSELKRNVPDERNAALVLIPLLKEHVKTDDLETYLRGESTQEAAQAQLAANEDVALQISEGSKLPDWYVDKYSGSDLMSVVSFPEYSGLKSWVKFFSYRAQIHAKSGDLKRAESDLLTASRLSNYLSHETTVIGALVIVACQAIVRTIAAQIVVESGGEAKEVEMARRVIHSFERADPNRAIGTEALYIMDWVNHFETYRKDFMQGASNESIAFVPVNSKRIGTPVLRSLIESREAQKVVMTNPALAKSIYLKTRVDSSGLWPAEQYWVEKLGIWFYDGAAYACVKSKISDSLTLAGLDIFDFRRKNGRYPKTLAELGSGTDLTDLWTGAKFGYKQEPQGFVIWSVGQDEKDDGGALKPIGPPSDILFQTILPSKPVVIGN